MPTSFNPQYPDGDRNNTVEAKKGQKRGVVATGMVMDPSRKGWACQMNKGHEQVHDAHHLSKRSPAKGCAHNGPLHRNNAPHTKPENRGADHD